MFSKKAVSWLVVSAGFVFWSSAVFAVDVQVSGFLTTIITQGSNDKDTIYGNRIATKDLEADTRDNHLGIQFSSSIDPRIDVTAQFISRAGPDNYSVETDWAYIDYKAFKNTKFRIGKYKVPQFIASDYQDVGYAYPWVRPPQDVYSTSPLISLNGIDMSYKINMLYGAKMFFDIYYGDGTHKSVIPPRTADAMELPAELKGMPILFETAKNSGFAIKYAAKTFTLRAGYFSTDVSADVDLGNGTRLVFNDVPGALGGIGFTMDTHNIIVYSEFLRRDTDPQLAGTFPDQDAWYVTLGYRFGKFLPTITQSKIRPGVDKSDLAIEERSTALGFRYDIGNSADVKFEALYVKPKEGNHGLFYEPVKSGTVYSVAFDVIF
jgi:hypothetical protein